jgi:hypothetical protein
MKPLFGVYEYPVLKTVLTLVYITPWLRAAAHY